MSKIAKLITEKLSYPPTSIAFQPKFDYADVSVNITEEYGLGVKYDVGVKLGAQVYIEFKMSDNRRHEIKTSMKRAVVEEIFGEFRPIINKMSVEVYNRDFEKLKGLIDRLYIQMFDEME